MPNYNFRTAIAFASLLALAPITAPQAGIGVCGAPSTDAPSDLSLEYAATKPASAVVCSMGYAAEKCGDHKTALTIFDKCIAAGYTGALIWKALMYEDGSGLPKDSTMAAKLLHQAALSGSGGYATLGKLHYATVLHEGRGVPRDEVESHKWFEAAAAEGDPDAKEFLRTGKHTASRDLEGRGVGSPGSLGAAADAADAAARAKAPEATATRTLERVGPNDDLPGSTPWLAIAAVALVAAGAIQQTRRLRAER
jgi:hypothetical protein